MVDSAALAMDRATNDDVEMAFEKYKSHIDDLVVEMRCDLWELDYKLTLIADDLRQIAEQVSILSAREQEDE